MAKNYKPEKIKLIKAYDGETPKEIQHLGSIKKYNGDEKIVEIPEIIDGETITEIGDFAFKDNKTVEEVILPNTILNIGYHAFSSCENLKKIHLNNGLLCISSSAFMGCVSIEEIVFPETLENIFHYAFYGCTGLKKVELKSNIKFKAENIFKNTKLEDVNQILLGNFNPENQVKLTLKKLENFDIYTKEEKKELITFINRRKNLKKAIFTNNNPKAITTLISQKVKLNLELLDEYLENSIKNEYTEITSILLNYKKNNFSEEQITNHQDQNELVEIGLELPTLKQLKTKWHATNTKNGIKITGYKGTNSTETIPKNTADGIPIIQVSYIKDKTYEPIEILNIDAQLEVLGEKTFFDNKTLREIQLPKTLTKIKNSCFSGCINLEKFDIPKNITIEGNPFTRCEKFADENGFTIINNTLYFYDGRDVVVTIPAGVKIVEEKSFSFLNTQEVIFQEGLEEIKDYAFNWCSFIEKISLPKTTKYDEFLALGFVINVILF